MIWLFDTIKGRVIVVLILFISASHVLGLWIYAQSSEQAATLLHDALLAEQIAMVVGLAERLPPSERPGMLQAISGPVARISVPSHDTERWPLPEGTRAHSFEHLLAIFLQRRTQEGIRLAFAGDAVDGLESLLAKVRSSEHGEWDHLPIRPMTDIRAAGGVSVEVALRDGSWLRFSAPLLTVNPFSPVKLGVPLAIMILSVLFIAACVLHRLTQPLGRFAAAAEQLGSDIYSPALSEAGPSEVRTAARSLNLMQQKIRRLLEDRTAFAAAIAHDLGTPITRIHLRAHEIDDAVTRDRLFADLEQMRRMIAGSLEFARLEVSSERSEMLDLGSLVQSLSDDYSDVGEDVSVERAVSVIGYSKPIALRRALANLVDNAIKYGMRARLSLTAAHGDVRITIRDDGPGIPQHMMEEAFRPFHRITQGGDQPAGTGLGLSIARSIIRGLGGDIVLSNARQGGLEAIVRLPVAKGVESRVFMHELWGRGGNTSA